MYDSASAANAASSASAGAAAPRGRAGPASSRGADECRRASAEHHVSKTDARKGEHRRTVVYSFICRPECPESGTAALPRGDNRAGRCAGAGVSAFSARFAAGAPAHALADAGSSGVPHPPIARSGDADVATTVSATVTSATSSRRPDVAAFAQPGCGLPLPLPR